MKQSANSPKIRFYHKSEITELVSANVNFIVKQHLTHLTEKRLKKNIKIVQKKLQEILQENSKFIVKKSCKKNFLFWEA